MTPHTTADELLIAQLLYDLQGLLPGGVAE